MEEAGLRDEECELLVRYYGFQVDGKERVESLAHDFDVRKEADIYNRIRGISTKLAQTSWAAHL